MYSKFSKLKKHFDLISNENEDLEKESLENENKIDEI